MATWPPIVIAGQVIESSHHNGILDNVARKKTALEGQLFFTPGSVIFADSSGFLDEDDNELFWDNTNKRLGIGIVTPIAALSVDSPGSASDETVTTFENPSASSFALAKMELRVFAAPRAQVVGQRDGATSGGFMILRTADSSGTIKEGMRISESQNVGIGNADPQTVIHVGTVSGSSGSITIDEETVTPSNPGPGIQMRIYMKDDKIIFQFNDAGTVRYKFLDLTGTGVTWVHTTTAP